MIDGLLAELAAAEAAARARGAAGHRRRASAPRSTPTVASYIDHARDIGAFNPCFPEYEITVDGDRASGTVSFPLAYEGPPGLVHGGFLAVFFDSVVQHHNCDVGVAGKTTSLALRYRRPTPLLTELRFEMTRAVDGSRIISDAQLLRDDKVLCEAHMDAIAGDRAALPAVSPRRSRRVTSSVIDAGDGLPLTVPQPAPRPGARPRRPRSCSPATTSSSATPTPIAVPRRSRAGCSRSARARARTSACCTRTDPTFVVGWLAAARIGAVTVPLSTFSTSAELLTLLRSADIEMLLSAESYRAHDYVDALARRDSGARSRRATAPLLSTDGARAAARRVLDRPRSSPRATRVSDAVLGRGRGRRHPRRSHGHRAHLGLDAASPRASSTPTAR